MYEIYNLISSKKVVSTVNVNNVEHALQAAADYAEANNIKTELTVKQVKPINETE
jgi:hypothetical protein